MRGKRVYRVTPATPGLLVAPPSRWGISVDNSCFLAPRQEAGTLRFSTFLGGGFREEDNTRAWPYSCCAKTSSERKRLVAQAPVSSTLGLGKCYQFPAWTVLAATVPLCPLIPVSQIYWGTLEGIFASQLPWREDWECSLL